MICEPIWMCKAQILIFENFLRKRKILKALAKSLENAEYHPKQFPGLIYQTENPKTVILLFDSGKIVGNGGTLEEIQHPLETLMKKLMMEGT